MSTDFIIKILTLGDSCVGKTSIIYRYTKTPFPKISFSTIGVDFRSRTVSLDNNKKVKFFFGTQRGRRGIVMWLVITITEPTVFF